MHRRLFAESFRGDGQTRTHDLLLTINSEQLAPWLEKYGPVTNTMQHHMDNKICHIEILTPKQNTEKLDEDLENFAEKYTAVVGVGYVACITDNPMGHLSFQATDIIPELALPVQPGQLMIHLNTFHTKDAMDQILDTAARMGAQHLLVVSGDGNERLPRLLSLIHI